MANPNLPKFEKGNKHAANAGNGNVKVRIIKSPLRRTSESLREVEPDALEVIKLAVRSKKEFDADGKEVNPIDRTQLDTAKWLIGMIQTLDKSASAEEIASANIRLKAKEAAQAGAGEDDMHKAQVSDHPTKPRLSLAYTPEEDDE